MTEAERVDPDMPPAAHPSTTHVFISYRRDDAPGYAGRLEDALEHALGHGSVFRDVPDIPPGDDFIHVIRERLSRAHAVLVLIGPRWLERRADGTRRIDSPEDFVRIEVQAALDSAARVVPVLLPGAAMPSAADLPPALATLATRNAITLTDAHWDAGVAQLLATLPAAGAKPGRRGLWVGAGAFALLAAVGATVGGALWLRPAPDPAEALLGAWQASVRYSWGDRHTERFEFKRHAGALAGTATFLGVALGAENLRIEGGYLRFETRNSQTMDDQAREVTRLYAAELRGDAPAPRLVFRMETRGGYDVNRPIEFEAVRAEPPPAR